MPEIYCLGFMLFLLSIQTGYSQDSCRIESENYVCENIIDTFPTQYFTQAYNLVCKYCSIEVFSETTFPHTNRLSSFNVSDSEIVQVTHKAFSKISDADFIDLRNNKITNISAGAFLGSREVRYLYLDNNHLETLTPMFLEDFEVNTVSISNNKLRTLPANSFQGVLSLLMLDLSGNMLVDIHQNAFEYLNTLEVLDLQNNSLCFIPLGAFKPLNHLRYLGLSNNKFAKFGIGVFTGLAALDYLNLANNSLSDFDSDMLITLPRLTDLDISGNSIYYLDSHTMHLNVPTLRRVLMGDNLFSCTVLLNVARYFRKAGVEIFQPNGKYDVQNINGIACSDAQIGQVIPMNIFYKTTHDDARVKTIYC